jgi:hypothetical protein
MRLGLALLLAAAPAFAQTETAVPAVNRDVSLSLFSPIASLIGSAITQQDIILFSVEYEHRIAESWTVYADPGIGIGTLLGRASVGGSLGVGARYYFGFVGAATPRGLWVGPDVSATLLSFLPARLWTAGFGAYAGYNFNPAKNLIISPGIGCYLRIGTFGLGPTPGARLNIGWGF